MAKFDPNDYAPGRIPPNQVVTRKFPVMTAANTPDIKHEKWSFSFKKGPKILKSWTWDEWRALPQTEWERDIHCVTRWSKLDTKWRGVTIDDLLMDAGIEPPTPYMLATTYEGYTTNVPVKDAVNGKAMIATHFANQPLEIVHGGPARLLVPHLYFWKSAKWIKSLQFTNRDEAGFWELRGYHIYGDPWKEERYNESITSS